jgi:hypothetical protein
MVFKDTYVDCMSVQIHRPTRSDDDLGFPGQLIGEQYQSIPRVQACRHSGIQALTHWRTHPSLWDEMDVQPVNVQSFLVFA